MTVKLEVVANGSAPVAPSQATRFRITVTDNGPGIVRQQIPRVCKVALWVKFHRMQMRDNRASAFPRPACTVGQLTTGKTGEGDLRTDHELRPITSRSANRHQEEMNRWCMRINRSSGRNRKTPRWC